MATKEKPQKKIVEKRVKTTIPKTRVKKPQSTLFPMFAKINADFRKKKGKEKRGRPISITIKILSDLLDSLGNGADQKQAALIAGISEATFYNYLASSPTFLELIRHAEQIPNILAEKALVDAIKGSPEKVIDSWDAKKKEYVKIYIPAVAPNVLVAEWWLERNLKSRFGKEAEPAPQSPLLGMPKTEEEADIVARLLAKAQEYAKPKETTKRTGSSGTSK